MSKQDRQGARTASDLEYRYAFGKSFAEVMGIATDARNAAEEAKRVSTSIEETAKGLSVKVNDAISQIGGEVALEVKEKNGEKYAQLRADVDEIRFDAGDVVIESDKFKLRKDGSAEFSGELKSPVGIFGGWTVDEFGIHQTHGVLGTYEITYSTTGTDHQQETYVGYMFYWLSHYGIYRAIFDRDVFYPYDPNGDDGRDDSLLWFGDIMSNYSVKKV